MYKKRKLLAFMLSVYLIIAFLFSAAFMSANAYHQCNHKKCSICLQIAHITETLKLINPENISMILAIPAIIIISFTRQGKAPAGTDTPVSLKIQLNL